MNSRERFFSSLNGTAPDYPPVFPLLMGFSAKHYGISYKEFASKGEAAAEAQLFILDKFSLDAITACTDAFRISADLGGDMVYPEATPPHLSVALVRKAEDIKLLRRPDPSKGRMGDRVKLVDTMVKHAKDKCVILGWVDMPFAEACSVMGVTEFIMFCVDEPKAAHKLLSFLTDIVVDFSIAQISAGADMIGAGDAAASLISPELYRQFALPYEKIVIDAVHNAGSKIKLHICGNTANHMEYMLETGADLFNVDHMVSLPEAKRVYASSGKAFKGNLNPVELLSLSPKETEEKVHELIKITSSPFYMVSPGCEVPLGVSDEVFRAFCNAARSYKKAYDGCI